MLQRSQMMPPNAGIFDVKGEIGFADAGRICSLKAGDPHGLDYFLFCPERLKADAPIMLSIHGYTRNAAEHAFRLAPLADAYGVILVVPHLTRKRYRRFHLLQPDTEGVFPEDALEAVLGDVKRRLGVAAGELLLFGYSGGGQFAHRYMMTCAGRVAKAALFAPGWYTWPDENLPYPFGLGDSETACGRQFSLENLGKSDIHVFVGEADIQRNGSLNTNPEIDRVQGTTRLERAKRWVSAINQDRPEDNRIGLTVLKGVGHDFQKNIVSRGVGEAVFDWLSGVESTNEKFNELKEQAK